MKCKELTPLIRDDGYVYTSVLMEDERTTRLLPYVQEHSTLWNKEIAQEADFYPTVVSAIQICPYCGAIIHRNDQGSWCMNVHCSGLRRTILLDQLAALGYSATLPISLTIDMHISNDKDFNLLGLFKLHPIAQDLRQMSFSQYLRLLRIPCLSDEDIETLNQVYSIPANLLQDVLGGGFLQRDVPLTKGAKESICLSMGYVNQEFAKQLLGV